MLSNWFLQLALLALAGLPRLVTADADPSALYGNVVQQPLNPPAVGGQNASDAEGELLLDECDASITACGTTADVKIIRTHKETSYVTHIHVFEDITTLPTSTRTVTEVVVSTKTTSIEVDVNTTTTREFVPIVPKTVTTVSWVEHKKISQCIIKRTSTSLASSDPSGSDSGSAQPVSSAQSSQHSIPSVSPSGVDSNSGQPTASADPVQQSSGQARRRSRYVRVDGKVDLRRQETH
ncbi:hypothetical protein NW756_004641 [Fusarium oxysporum]|nr:hypothetical protein NW753_003800 [Fusarium oxysporum]KAJ4095821.1 hypothetical protein NW756_004641 [Fusarium oxysporum]